MSTKTVITRPQRVKVSGTSYKVQYVLGKPLGKDEIGEHDSEKQLISVKDGLPLEREQLTFLHECLHALSDSTGLELSERQIDGLESGLYSLLRDNPSAVAYLQRRK